MHKNLSFPPGQSGNGGKTDGSHEITPDKAIKTPLQALRQGNSLLKGRIKFDIITNMYYT
jgi:hypothetical protein